MALAYGTILPSCKIYTTISGRYTSFSEETIIHENIPKIRSLEKLKVGDTDLCLDISLDPLIDAYAKCLKVHDVKDLLEFVGNGDITLFRSMTVFCGTNSILRSILHIHFEYGNIP